MNNEDKEIKIGDLVKVAWGADMAVVLELVNYSYPYAKLLWVRASDGYNYTNVFPLKAVVLVSESR